MAVVMEPLDGSQLDRSIYPFNLAIGPRMVGFGEPVLDPVGFTDHVETHLPRIGGVSVPGLLGMPLSVRIVWIR